MAYLFIDWCRLPGAITNAAAATASTGGWAGGCVVRLWEKHCRTRLPGGGAADVPAPLFMPLLPFIEVVEVVGDTRYGDITFLPAPLIHTSPPPAPPQPPPPPAQQGQQQQQQQALGSLNPSIGTCSGGTGDATTPGVSHGGRDPSASAVYPAVAGSAGDVLRRLPEPTPLARAWVEAVGWDPLGFEALGGVYGRGEEGQGPAVAGAAAEGRGPQGLGHSGPEVAARLQVGLRCISGCNDALAIFWLLDSSCGGVAVAMLGDSRCVAEPRTQPPSPMAVQGVYCACATHSVMTMQ